MLGNLHVTSIHAWAINTSLEQLVQMQRTWFVELLFCIFLHYFLKHAFIHLSIACTPRNDYFIVLHSRWTGFIPTAAKIFFKLSSLSYKEKKFLERILFFISLPFQLSQEYQESTSDHPSTPDLRFHDMVSRLGTEILPE